jgi:UDP-N-acetylglucosamine--N-acetylmuramyl-(pentapeptide) pyrophosphoryl-undecaprenol N-acetylglucosamine transferase
MTATVLWYVHDHGAGHLARAAAVLPHLAVPVVVAAGPGIAARAAQLLDVPVVSLPGDVPDPPQPTVGPWHHAPSCLEQRRRTAALAAAIDRHRCTTAVVDVSMEVTVLARLHGLRVVTVRQSGCRDDAAHRIGLASADVVWVPQHRELEPISDPVDGRWRFTGPFSRLDVGVPPPLEGRTDTRRAVLLVGAGGTSFDDVEWRCATAPRGWEVVIVGTEHRWRHGGVTSLGRIADVGPVLAGADVVIAGAGWGAVADAVAVGARLVLIAEHRPFAEQATRVAALAAAGLAVDAKRWPAPSGLGPVLAAAERLEPGRWARYHDGHGAHRAAALVAEVHAA